MRTGYALAVSGIGAGHRPARTVDQNEIGVDAVVAVDDAEPVSGHRGARGVLRFQSRPECRVGRPPTHIGGTLIEVPDNQLHQGLRQVGEPRGLQRRYQTAALIDPLLHVGLKHARPLCLQVSELLHFLRDHGETSAGLPSPRRLDDGIERQ